MRMVAADRVLSQTTVSGQSRLGWVLNLLPEVPVV